MIYSPSRGGTQTFQRCPFLWDLEKRWESLAPPNEEIEIGNKIHAALAAEYSGTPMAVDDPVVASCVQRALKINLLGTTGRVLAVEQEMGPEKCHPDLVLIHTNSLPMPDHEEWLQVVDWKFSLTLKPEWVAKRLASYETLWQLKHYAWRVQQEFGLPCRQVTIVQMAVQMAGLPKPAAWRVDYEMTPEMLVAWEKSARQWWNLMDFGYNAQNYNGCRKYGENHLCKFYAGCHTLAGDESRFDTLYRRK